MQRKAGSLAEVGDEFRVELDRVDDMDQVRVMIEPSSESAELSDRGRKVQVPQAWKAALGLRVDVDVVPHGSLPRTQFKADRLTDRRRKLHEG
ncbi:MAG TPA: hypothetical protein VMY37_32340 [Thermoguttaceae bacterium]|nr:hypothetical protein [Thermoguttaceae bacterium]